MTEMKKVNEELVEVPVTGEGADSEQVDNQNLLNLEDVGYMIMVGRTREGETFFRTVGTNDLVTIRGLVEYARDEVKFEFNKHFKASKGE